jgi:hypothetical protein
MGYQQYGRLSGGVRQIQDGRLFQSTSAVSPASVLHSRRVHHSGCTTKPHAGWMTQAGRELTNFEEGDDIQVARTFLPVFPLEHCHCRSEMQSSSRPVLDDAIKPLRHKSTMTFAESLDTSRCALIPAATASWCTTGATVTTTRFSNGHAHWQRSIDKHSVQPDG